MNDEKKILKVKLIKNESVFCRESAMATVANWLGRDYRMLYAGMLGFDYEVAESIDEDIESRVSAGFKREELSNVLKKYHGVEVFIEQVDKGNIIDIVEKQINNNMPVMSYLLPEYCYWTKETEYRTYYLIIGYDSEKVYGFDLHSDSDEVMELSKDIFITNYAFQNEVLTFAQVSEQAEVSIENICEILHEKKYDNETTFLHMVNFADELLDSLGGKLQYSREKRYWNVGVLNVLIDIVRGRKLFAEACYYVSEKTNDDFALYFGTCYEEIGERWNYVWRTLAKAYVLSKGKQSNDKCMEIVCKVVEEIKDIANEERNAIQNLFGKRKIGIFIRKACETLGYDKNDKWVNLDIKSFFDKKGFEEAGCEVKPDLTGQKEYFASCNLDTDRCIHFGDLSQVIETGYDNFVCKEQQIAVPEGAYRKIVFIGCAEWGAGSGKIMLEEENGREYLFMDYRDW